MDQIEKDLLRGIVREYSAYEQPRAPVDQREDIMGFSDVILEHIAKIAIYGDMTGDKRKWIWQDIAPKIRQLGNREVNTRTKKLSEIEYFASMIGKNPQEVTDTLIQGWRMPLADKVERFYYKFIRNGFPVLDIDLDDFTFLPVVEAYLIILRKFAKRMAEKKPATNSDYAKILEDFFTETLV